MPHNICRNAKTVQGIAIAIAIAMAMPPMLASTAEEQLDVAALQVSTKDGALLLRHNLTLDDSTTIAEHPEFADRRSLY